MNEFERRFGDDPEREIDRVLRALGSAEPSAGLGERVLAALEERGAERRSVTPRFSQRWFWGLAGAAVVAAVGVLLVVVAGVQHRGAPVHVPEQAQIRSHGGQVMPPVSRVALAPKQVSPSTRGKTGTSPNIRLAVVAERPTGETDLPGVHIALPLPSAAELDQQAWADFHAASQPAPPLPPTAEERQVRLMLRRGEKHDLAQLDPSTVSAYFAQEGTAFRAFFDPPPDPQIAEQPRSLADLQKTSPKPISQGDTPK
jgi:hypothetical protein